MKTVGEMSFAVVGTGLVGLGWGVVFAQAAGEVRLYDLDPSRAVNARDQIVRILTELADIGIVRDPEQCASKLLVCSELNSALSGVDYIQESVGESVQLKSSLFGSLPRVEDHVIIASSTSTISPELIFEGSAQRGRCIVAHPFNPPYVVPLVEVLRSSWTTDDTCTRTKAVLRELGMSPMPVHRPVVGFVVNRLQAAVINEAMHLVETGVIDPDGLDQCMTDGLGLRWAFIGPFATMDLNAPGGIAEYVEKFASAYDEIGRSLAVCGGWGEGAKRAVVEARRDALPLEKLEDARAARDRAVLALRKNRGAWLSF